MSSLLFFFPKKCFCWMITSKNPFKKYGRSQLFFLQNMMIFHIESDLYNPKNGNSPATKWKSFLQHMDRRDLGTPSHSEASRHVYGRAETRAMRTRTKPHRCGDSGDAEDGRPLGIWRLTDLHYKQIYSSVSNMDMGLLIVYYDLIWSTIQWWREGAIWSLWGIHLDDSMGSRSELQMEFPNHLIVIEFDGEDHRKCVVPLGWFARCWCIRS